MFILINKYTLYADIWCNIYKMAPSELIGKKKIANKNQGNKIKYGRNNERSNFIAKKNALRSPRSGVTFVKNFYG